MLFNVENNSIWSSKLVVNTDETILVWDRGVDFILMRIVVQDVISNVQTYSSCLSLADVFIYDWDIVLVCVSYLKTRFLFAADTEVFSATDVFCEKIVPSADIFGGVRQMLHPKRHAAKEFTTVETNGKLQKWYPNNSTKSLETSSHRIKENQSNNVEYDTLDFQNVI